MRFVTRDSGKEVSLSRGVNQASLSLVPPDVVFSGIASVRAVGYRGTTVLVTTSSQVQIFGESSKLVWEASLSDLLTESNGIDLVRLVSGNKIIQIGTGLSRRENLLRHLQEAKEFSNSGELPVVNQKFAVSADSRDLIDARREIVLMKKKLREEQKADRQRTKHEVKIAALESYGKLVVESACAGKTVQIYSKGYVRIYGFFGRDAPYQKLLGISASADVSKKTVIGRGIVAAMTLGANLMYTPNKRGDLYLTISTDQETHVLHMSPPSKRDLQAMHKLATAGQAVLDTVGNLHVRIDTPMDRNNESIGSLSIAEEISKLGVLRDSGLLSEDEFLSAKRKLL